jgi:hypothetical protein
MPAVWQCIPQVRPDGCPGSQPGGGACATEGQTCDYTCSCEETATCTNHQWVAHEGPCKP